MTKYYYYNEVYDSYEEALEDALLDIDESELVSLWNNYCDYNDFKNVIHYMEEFDEYCRNMLPSEVARNITSAFYINEAYFIDGDNGFESFDYADLIVDYFELARWLSDKRDVYECSAFSEIEEIDDSDNN